MENQHRKIKGYRELDAQDIAAMNRIKEKGEELGQLIDDLHARNADARWVAIGQTQLQQGIMALTRSVAKPEFF